MPQRKPKPALVGCDTSEIAVSHTYHEQRSHADYEIMRVFGGVKLCNCSF
jgi:hypothetical protein